MELTGAARFVGFAVVVAIVLLILVNGVMLLISPSRWFSMPAWLRFQGTIRRSRYSGWIGELPLRLFGAELVAVILWIGYEAFGSPKPDALWFLDIPSVILKLVLCIGLGVTGALMVLNPQWIFDRDWKPALEEFRPNIGGEPQDVRDHLSISFFIHFIRTMGLVAVALAGLLSWALFR